MQHFLSLLRVHSMCSVSVWKALRKNFSKSEAACQENHGGSFARAFDLICRSVVMLWYFRHHQARGKQTVSVMENRLASPFTLTSPSVTAPA